MAQTVRPRSVSTGISCTLCGSELRQLFSALITRLSPVPVAPVEIAERPKGAQRGRDANADAANEETGPDDEPEQHAAADDLATPRAPETPSRCSRLI